VRADRALRRPPCPSERRSLCWSATDDWPPGPEAVLDHAARRLPPATRKRRNLALGSDSELPRAEPLGRHARNKPRSAPLNPLASAYQPPAAALVRLRRRSRRWGRSRKTTILAVMHPATISHAERILVALRQHGQEIGQLGVAILLDELRDVVATAPGARLALDRKGRDAEIRERVRVLSHRRLNSGFLTFSQFRHRPLE
jgi:hypothetical protein